MMKIVGINIKRVRAEKKITLRELARKVSVSASFLSQVETGRTSPSLATLKGIAEALETTVSALIGDALPEGEQMILKKHERRTLEGIGTGVRMHLLTSPAPNKQMEPLLFKLDPHADSGKTRYKHFGQEFVIVLKGAMEISLNGVRYHLSTGDSIYFNSHVPHSFRNMSAGATEALWVVTPPTF